MASGNEPRSEALVILVLAITAVAYQVAAFLIVIVATFIYVPLLESDLDWLARLEEDGVGAERIGRYVFSISCQIDNQN